MKRVVLFLSGVPGSGKSTIAKYLAKGFGTDLICTAIICADEYHGYYVNGNYFWTKEVWEAAHKWCREKFVSYLTEGKVDVIVVDNTNLNENKRKFYSDLAKKHGWETTTLIILPEIEKIDLYVERNKHGVSRFAILEMTHSFYKGLSKIWNKLLSVKMGYLK